MRRAPLVALEIGTSKVCALVGEVREDNNIMIIGMGQCVSCGVRKSIILDLDSVIKCIQIALERAEKTGKLDIRQVYMTISGGHIHSLVSHGIAPVYDVHSGICRDEIEQVMNTARSVNLSPDSDVLHTIPQNYSVDGQRGITNPEGMHGAQLSVDMLIIHVSRNHIRNAVKAVSGLGIDVLDVVFAGLCAALATLTPEQKASGVALLDIGGGSTSYVVYANNTIATAGVLAVGGDHITNDIALGLNLPLKRAERLKCESGSAVLETSTYFQRIPIPAEGGFSAASVAVCDLTTIINARVSEFFMLIRNDLEKKSLLHHLAAGIVLTGGSAHLKGINSVAEEIFDMPCSIGKPINFSGMPSVYEGPEYAAPLGLLRHASTNASHTSEILSLSGFLKRLFLGNR